MVWPSASVDGFRYEWIWAQLGMLNVPVAVVLQADTFHADIPPVLTATVNKFHADVPVMFLTTVAAVSMGAVWWFTR
jgi:hypothetical protein